MGDHCDMQDQCKLIHCHVELMWDLNLEKMKGTKFFLSATLTTCAMMPSRMSWGRDPGASWWCCADLTTFSWWWITDWNFFSMVAVTFEENQMLDSSRSASKVFVCSNFSSRWWRCFSWRCYFLWLLLGGKHVWDRWMRALKQNEMEWNGMKWNEMEWNGMKWNEMEWNGMKWNEMEWNGTEQNEISVFWDETSSAKACVSII